MRIGLLGLLVILTACTGLAYTWQPIGITVPLDQATYECQRDVAMLPGPRQQASPSLRDDQTGAQGLAAATSNLAASLGYQEDKARMLEMCMRAKGWERVLTRR